MGRLRSEENSRPIDPDGKIYTRSESRPLGKTTYFTCIGDKTDSPQEIGGGQELSWDFSNSDNNITPSGVSYTRKRIEFSFIDNINIKEGTIYWKDKLFGSYIDLYVVCPNGEYYLDNNKDVQLATEDTIINHFVSHHMMMDTNQYGDELNTESASNEITKDYKYWLEITVPNTDSSSKGYISIELYRPRTVIL